MCSGHWILKRLQSHQIKDTIHSGDQKFRQIIQEQRKSVRLLKPLMARWLFKENKIMGLIFRKSRPCKCLLDVSQR